MSLAAFIASQRTEHRVPHAVACRALQVSESWFYKWRDRPPTPGQQRRAELDAKVAEVFGDSGGTPGTYGSPRVWAELVELGWTVSEKTVAARLPALRISAGCDSGEWVPVGLAGVEQDSDAVVGEAAEAEPDPLDALDQVVRGLGGTVRDVGVVPGHDLVVPAGQGAA